MYSIKQKSIVFIGIPCFPIAIERALSKTLLERPVVATQSASSRAICLAVSREAQQSGIRKGMRLFEARRRNRQIMVIQPDVALFMRATQAIQEIIRNYSPVSEVAQPGQFYLDLTGCERLFGGISNAVRDLRRQISNNLRLPADAGIAVNKLVSRIAALDADPQGLMEIEMGGEEEFLAPHKAIVLPAVDDQLRTQLADLNISYVQQIKEIGRETLLASLGLPALALASQARGLDPSPVLPPSSSLRVTRTEILRAESNDPEVLAILIQRLILSASLQLSEQGLVSRELILSIYYSDGRFISRQKRLNNQAIELAQYFVEIFELFNHLKLRRTRVKQIDLTFDHLSRASSQCSLWDNLSVKELQNFYGIPDVSCSNSSQDEVRSTVLTPDQSRSTNLFQALASIRKRFGEQSINLGLLQ